MNQCEQATGIPERGRSLLWSDLHGLRTSIHHIAGECADPLLAEKSTEIYRGFEMLTMSTLPNGSTEVSDDDGADPCLRCGR